MVLLLKTIEFYEVTAGSLGRLCTVKLCPLWRPVDRTSVETPINSFLDLSHTYVSGSQAFPRHSPCENKRRYLCIRCRHGLLPFR